MFDRFNQSMKPANILGVTTILAVVAAACASMSPNSSLQAPIDNSMGGGSVSDISGMKGPGISNGASFKSLANPTTGTFVGVEPSPQVVGRQGPVVEGPTPTFQSNPVDPDLAVNNDIGTRGVAGKNKQKAVPGATSGANTNATAGTGSDLGVGITTGTGTGPGSVTTGGTSSSIAPSGTSSFGTATGTSTGSTSESAGATSSGTSSGAPPSGAGSGAAQSQ